MRPTRSIRLRFPVGGVAKRHGYEYQPQHTTPDALNVWSCQSSTGRYRGGVRPGLASLSGSVGGAPYGWSPATWVSGTTTYRGVAVVSAGGCKVSVDGGTWSAGMTDTSSTNFASCTVYNSQLYLARFSEATLYYTLTNTTTSGAGTPLSSAGDGGAGTAPVDCGIVTTAMDRLWLAGDEGAPHVLYACRIGDPTAWDYSLTDQGAAFTTGGTNGLITEPITALINHGSNCLIIGCRDSMHVIRGNPRAGGVRQVHNQMHGPLNNNCWCKDEQNNTWFLSRLGLYRIPAGCISDAGEIESMSRERVPRAILGIDPGASDKACIGYDPLNRGIHIAVDRSGAGTDEYWFYDLMDGGFWPMSFPDAHHLYANLPGTMDEDDSPMLVINSSGSVYQYRSDQTTDYSNAIDSRLYVGPIKLGNDDKDGILVDCFPVLAENSGNMAWSVQVGDSAQEAYANSAQFTGSTWDIQGLNHRQHPRARGHSAYLKLEDVSGSVWSFEEIVVNTQPGGRRRVY